MTAIRLPVSAESLLPFCRRSEESVHHACFDTFADLVVFAASCGYHRLGGRIPEDPKEFIKWISPIDLAVFKNLGLFPNLLLIGLGAEQNAKIACNEEHLCRLAECFANVGFKYLGHELISWTQSRFYMEVGRLCCQISESFQKDKI